MRIDVSGIGDSIITDINNENNEYINSSSSNILDAIAELDSDYKNKEYILMGLCSGAYFSFHAALNLHEINIVDTILINPLTFYWEDGMSADNSPTKEFSIWNWYKKALISHNSWNKLIRGKIDYSSLFQALVSRFKIRFMPKLMSLQQHSTVKDSNRHRVELGTDLTKIIQNDTHIQFILSRSDPGYDILMTNAGKAVKRLKRNHKIDIHFIENADHTFSRYKPRSDIIEFLYEYFKNKLPSTIQ